MLRNLTYLSLLLLIMLSACGDTQPPAATEAELLESSNEVAKASALPAEQDQVAFTRNANPEVVKDEQLPEAEATIGRTTASVMSDEKVEEVTRVPSVAIKPRTKPEASTTSSPPTGNETHNTPAATSTTTNSATTPPTPAPAASPEPEPAAAATTTKSDHSAWNSLLRKHVAGNGDVDYAGFKRDINKLDAYLDELRAGTPDESYSRAEAMAYWINAYNAFTVKRILNDYPVSSIRDLDGGDPWKVKWIELDGKTYSLNQIEHDILRPRYGDARIHFAVNCAATSCPPLPNQAFTAGNLNSLLETRTRAFIRNPSYNQIDGGQVKVSKIFDWYGEDFGDLRTYLNKYLATPIDAGRDIAFADYDWSLNKQ